MAKESLLDSSISHSKSPFLIFTAKNSPFSKPQGFCLYCLLYLDLLFTRDDKNYRITRLLDKYDAFGFHIVNFPFVSSNILSGPGYGVCSSLLTRYAN